MRDRQESERKKKRQHIKSVALLGCRTNASASDPRKTSLMAMWQKQKEIGKKKAYKGAFVLSRQNLNKGR
jgi:hypothetical protein